MALRSASQPGLTFLGIPHPSRLRKERHRTYDASLRDFPSEVALTGVLRIACESLVGVASSWAASLAATRSAWLEPIMMPLLRRWKQYMSSRRGPGRQRHAGSDGDPHSWSGVRRRG
jgi:hypothetical protein